MDLAFRDLGGNGSPIVILHGLFGSSQNWAGMGRRLASNGRVLAVDLRNHGDSPHARPHSLTACVQDLADWSRLHAPGPLRLIGHSMGGLVAMGFALRHPDSTAGVAAIDIAPRPYPPEHQAELSALRTDIGACSTRAEMDALLAPMLPDARTRQFLLTNAVRNASDTGDGRDGRGFRWRIDADILAQSTVAADFAAVTGSFAGEALLAATDSGYVKEEDASVMRRYFPRVHIVHLPGADHWPHVSAPAELEAALADFLVRCNKAAPRPSYST